MTDDVDRARDLVVIGASAGGVDVLKRVVAALPPDLGAAVCIVLHVAPSSPSALARILARSGPLACCEAGDGDRLERGQILVAPPDRHLVVEGDRVRLSTGPRENGHRPAVDALFRSAAHARDGRVIGVVLSGNRDDGAAGLATIKAGGGAAIVQDPADALYPGMPTSAIASVEVDVVVPAEHIAGAIAAMVKPDDPSPSDPNDPSHPSDPPAPPSPRPRDEVGPPNPLISICPECGGVLTEGQVAGVVQWSCHVGHRYSPESLADSQAASVEAAMWTAIRALEERSAMLERMADQSSARAQRRSAGRFRHQARDAREQAQLVRAALDQAAATTLRHVGEETPRAEEMGIAG
jgi:two-component system, chemotaxis family, protein-glutamate methylesterase/glutaminase